MTPDSTAPLTENPIPAGGRNAESLVLLNTGNGKGKSSAAFGVMVRAVARDWKVAVVQFVKSSEWKVGEEKVGRQLGVEWRARGGGFTWDSSNLQHDIDLARAAWHEAEALISGGEYDLVILDELTYLCAWGWVSTDDVVRAVRGRPSHVNIVITGRDAPQEFVDMADTVTEMRHVKHAYDQGILAKRGIDY